MILNITVPPDVFSLIMSGNKRVVSTRRNPRKNRYFECKQPDMAKINGAMFEIIRVDGTAEEWICHLGKQIS